MTASGKKRSISVTMVRKLKASPRAVYAAWTRPNVIARWLAPGLDSVTAVSVDLRKGGRYRVDAVDSHGRPYVISGTYLDLVEDRRIVMSWSYDGPVSDLRSDATIVAAELRTLDDNATELTLTHEKIPDRKAATIHQANWVTCFDKLGEAAPQACAECPSDRDGVPRDFYTDGHRKFQARFGTRQMADRLEALTVGDRLKAEDAAFIAHQNMFFLATADAYGQPNCSYKGGTRGFVSVLDEQTIAFPDYNGNGMHLSVGNIDETGKVALLFIDFERQARLRVLGAARVLADERLMKRYPGAQLIVRVSVESVFYNCPRYVHKMQLVEESVYVPDGQSPAPAPAWKRLRAVADALPEDEQHLAGDDTDEDAAMNKK